MSCNSSTSDLSIPKYNSYCTAALTCQSWGWSSDGMYYLLPRIVAPLFFLHLVQHKKTNQMNSKVVLTQFSLSICTIICKLIHNMQHPNCLSHFWPISQKIIMHIEHITVRMYKDKSTMPFLPRFNYLPEIQSFIWRKIQGFTKNRVQFQKKICT